MRSFTKKNIDYVCSGKVENVDYATGNSLYILLYTDGTNGHIQKLRNEFETPQFLKAAKALVSLVMQWKQDDWNSKNADHINIEGMIDAGEVKRAFLTLSKEDFVKNENGATPFDIIDAPQPNKRIDFHSIINTDGVKLKSIEKLIIERQFFKPKLIVETLKKAPFNLGNLPDNIPDVVIKNVATLLVLRQVLSAVKVRSRYENLYGFTYPDPAIPTPVIKLNHFVYRSVVPVTTDAITILGLAVTEAKKINIGKGKTCETLPWAIQALKDTAESFKDFVDNNNTNVKAVITKIKGYKRNNLPSSGAGRKNTIDTIDELVNVLDAISNKKSFDNCKDLLITAIGAATATNKNVATNKTLKGIDAAGLQTITDKVKEAIRSLLEQFSSKPPINSDNFKLKPELSKFVSKNGNPIIGSKNTTIDALAPGHVNFKTVLNEVEWERQSMKESVDANGLSLIPFNEGEEIVAAYINAADADRKKVKDSIETQGKALVAYIEKHYSKDNAKMGYRQAKKTMIFKQGLYCGFCETPFADGRVADIEHKLPKSIFPTQALNWNNFVLCCKVCNSDFKKEKYIWKDSDDKGPQDSYLLNNFESRTNAGTKNYLECKKIAEAEVLWPDKKHDAIIAGSACQLLPFQAITSSKPPGLNLANIHISTFTRVHTQTIGNTKTHQVDFIGVDNGIVVNDVSVVLKTNLPASPAPVSIQASTDHIISICGLDKVGPSYWNDQRIVSRTKAWLNAMKQLKILTDFNVARFIKLKEFYQDQLHAVNIKHGAATTVRSSIETLTDTKAVKAVAMDIISGTIKVATEMTNGKVNIDLADKNATTNPGGSGTQVSINNGNTKINNDVIISLGSLSGDIMEVAGKRTMTGKMIVKTKIPGYNANDKIILFRDVDITQLAFDDTRINIAPGQGIVSDDVSMLDTWDENRADLLRIIDQTNTILKDYLWENVTDMVRFGGYYSTWVHTFQDNRPTRDGKKIPYDMELVKRLEEKALESHEDPCQFHGTDAEEIIACL